MYSVNPYHDDGRGATPSVYNVNYYHDDGRGAPPSVYSVNSYHDDGRGAPADDGCGGGEAQLDNAEEGDEDRQEQLGGVVVMQTVITGHVKVECILPLQVIRRVL